MRHRHGRHRHGGLIRRHRHSGVISRCRHRRLGSRHGCGRSISRRRCRGSVSRHRNRRWDCWHIGRWGWGVAVCSSRLASVNEGVRVTNSKPVGGMRGPLLPQQTVFRRQREVLSH